MYIQLAGTDIVVASFVTFEPELPQAPPQGMITVRRLSTPVETHGRFILILCGGCWWRSIRGPTNVKFANSLFHLTSGSERDID